MDADTALLHMAAILDKMTTLNNPQIFASSSGNTIYLNSDSI